jgi:RNA polymerase sigma-70 factor (ECF subfamily)
MLSQPDEDFTGGESVFVEQRPRQQSRPMVARPRQGEAIIFPVRHRPKQGSRRHYRVQMRHGVSAVHAGERHVLGIIFHNARYVSRSAGTRCNRVGRVGVLKGMDDGHGAAAPHQVVTGDHIDQDAEAMNQGTDEATQQLCEALIVDFDAGFAEFMREYSGIVYSVARGLTITAADAEDLASEAFLRAYRALCGYDRARIAQLALRPWLLTILRNTARNAARDATRRPAGPTRREPTEHNLDPGHAIAADPAGRAEQDEAQRVLGTLLAELPEAQRTAVVLRHALGMSIAEIALVLNVKDGTAKSHISRGLQQLRALVTDTVPAGSILRADDTATRNEPGEGGTAHRVLTLGRRRR